MSNVPDIKLNNGNTIPQFGFGVFQIPQQDTAEAVRVALDAGYRHLDTAQMYGNEREVGQGIRDSDVPREDVFVTTKLSNDHHGADNALRELDRSLEKLGIDYLDLYLIHWPLPDKGLYVETWQAFERAAADGRARSIGVSNFQPAQLDELAARTGTVPAINQVELHPLLQQEKLREYHQQHGIATEAWSPIAQGEVLEDSTLTGLADKYGKSAAQVVLRWHIQLGNIVFPKSVTPSRIRDNIDIFDFALDDEDLRAIAGLEQGKRTGPDPNSFTG